MRIRSVLIFPLVVLTGALSVTPWSAHAADPPAVTARGATPTTHAATAEAARTAVLPTGERVRLVGPTGRERVLISGQAPSGPASTMMTRRLGKHLYVFPATAEPYLGRLLDPELFDVSRLASLQAGNRLRVVLSYTGASPAVPGVEVTSASNGKARGFLTRSSSAAFGAALANRWRADAAAGSKARSPFSGVSAIKLDAPSVGGVKPAFVQYTLIIKTIGSDGKPQPVSFLTVLNIDNGNKYANFALAQNGEARISVPAGRYSIIGDEYLYNDAAKHASLRLTTVDEYAVTAANQTVTVDQRTATARPRVSTPRPASLTDYVFELDRSDAKDESGVGLFDFVNDDVDVYFSPVVTPARGTFTFTQNWVLDGSTGAAPAYNYNLATLDHAIAPDLLATFTPAQLATLTGSYYGDGSASPAGFSRAALFEDGGGGGVYDRIVRGTRRTEYVGAKGGEVEWEDSALLNYDAEDDPGFVDGDVRELPAGSTASIDWFHGPLVAAIPSLTASGYCFACRTSTKMSLGIVPVTDTDPTHLGFIFGAGDGLPVARFRLYRNSTRVRDVDDALGADLKVTTKRARYQAVYDVNRRLVEPVQSTQSHTELGFTSKKGTGKKLSKHDFCDYEHCRVLPIVQAKAALPTDLQGRLPAGKVPVTVTVARIQGATPSTAKSATLEYRPAGYNWSSVPLTPNGNGTYTGIIDNTGLANAKVDIRVRGADKGGSTYDQTVLRAYTVAAA